MGPQVAEVESVLAGYGNRVRVARYDPTTAAGASFARAKGIDPDNPRSLAKVTKTI